MERRSISDASNNRGNWNHIKIIQTISEQHTVKARNQGTGKTAVFGTPRILRKIIK